LLPSKAPTTLQAMREAATLKLDSGEELRVDVEREDLDRDEIVVRRVETGESQRERMLAVVDEIIAKAKPHPAGTTDRLLQADRERPYQVGAGPLSRHVGDRPAGPQ
jgi:hypothetical protein